MSRSRRLISLLIGLSSLVGPVCVADSRALQDQVEPRGQPRTQPGPEQPQPAPAMGIDPHLAPPMGAQPGIPRWLEEVRAQRRALHEQRRAAHRAHRETLESINAAQREERQEQVRRRQEEVRERRLYLNRGPWLAPLIPTPPYPADDVLTRGSLLGEQGAETAPGAATGPSPDALTPSDWDNLWYYRGW